LDIVQEVQSTGQVLRENRFEINEGEKTRTIVGNAAPLTQSAGAPPGVVAAFQEVSERVQREGEYQHRLTGEIRILEELVVSQANPADDQVLGLPPLRNAVPKCQRYFGGRPAQVEAAEMECLDTMFRE